MTTPHNRTRLYFRLFNEIGIIEHLASTVLESRLPPGLLAAHFKLLNHLVRVADGRSPLDMATAFQVPKTTMTHHVKVLERHGYVTQAANPDDGRYKQVWLTARGRALCDATVDGFGDVVAAWSGTIPEAEVADLVPRLERIRRLLDAARDTDPTAGRTSEEGEPDEKAARRGSGG